MWRRLPLARATQLALAATILLVVFGSSSVDALKRVGTEGRWVGLFVFAGFAALNAIASGARLGRVRAVHGFAFLLCGLALTSTAWSVEAHLSFERAGAFTVALLAAAAVAAAVDGRRERAEAFAASVVATAVAVCLAGIIVYVVNPGLGAVAATLGTPFRFNGLGESPNTIPMLAAVAAPLAAWLAGVRTGRRRALFVAGFAVFLGTIVASGSRSAIVGVSAAIVVFALLAGASWRRRLALTGAALVLVGGLVAGFEAMVSLTALPPHHAGSQASRPVGASPGPFPKVVLPNFADELGAIPVGSRVFFGRDGRLGALQEGFDQGSERPVFGWGFGTEERVFIERLAQFQSALPENSYVDAYLQLGGLGTALFLALAAAIAVAAARARTSSWAERSSIAGWSGAVAAGYGLSVGQSYAFSVGNVATVSFWLSVFLLGTLAAKGSPISRRAVLLALAAAAVLLVLIPLARLERAHAQHVQLAGMTRLWHRGGARVDGGNVDGFRRGLNEDCLLYDADGTPIAYELCFDRGNLVQAIDRRGGRFRAWTIQPYGAGVATVHIAPALLARELRRLHAFEPRIAVGPAYLARRPSS